MGASASPKSGRERLTLRLREALMLWMAERMRGVGRSPRVGVSSRSIECQDRVAPKDVVAPRRGVADRLPEPALGVVAALAVPARFRTPGSSPLLLENWLPRSFGYSPCAGKLLQDASRTTRSERSQDRAASSSSESSPNPRPQLLLREALIL